MHDNNIVQSIIDNTVQSLRIKVIIRVPFQVFLLGVRGGRRDFKRYSRGILKLLPVLYRCSLGKDNLQKKWLSFVSNFL